MSEPEMRTAIELDGTWKVSPVDDSLRRELATGHWSDEAFVDIQVPSHWQRHPDLTHHDGPVLHTHRFDASLPPGIRSWLVLDGIFYQSDVWLNGAYIGDTEGYFFPHRLEITEPIASRSEHHLALDVSCARQSDPAAKRNLTGIFQHSDFLDPGLNPGGIWRSVRIEHSGPLAIRNHRVLCTDADANRAVVSVRLVLDSLEPVDATIVTTISGVENVRTTPLASGENRVEWTVPIENPTLWWPRSLGEPVMHDVRVEVRTPDGELSDSRSLRIGLRSVEMRDWITRINGERLYLKGANIGPVTQWPAEATAAQHAEDLRLAAEAGLDMLRLHAHVAPAELYDLADEAGMLLWQDLPLNWGYSRSVRRQAVRQAREAVDLLGHHPSVIAWFAHNEPAAIDMRPEVIEEPRRRRRLAARSLSAQQLPNFNRSVLDRLVARSLRSADRSRPVTASSGVMPHLPSLDGTDSHLWFGWYHGHERELPELCALFPRMARFVGAFGAQAVPETAEFCEPERWPDLDWERMVAHHNLQLSILERHVPPNRYATFDAWREATQQYQANLIRHHVETLRRIKYRPSGGFAQHLFADAHPAISWSALDHERIPKAAYRALAAACAPVIVVADRLPDTLTAGHPLAVDVHVVSDLRSELTDIRANATLSWPGGRHAWSWEGDVPADECVRIGTLRFVVPETRGRLSLDLELAWDGGKATNSDHSTVV